MNRFKTRIMSISVAALIFCGITSLVRAEGPNNMIPVVAMKVAEGTISSEILTTGEVIPNLGVDVHPDVAGQIQQILVAEGSFIKAGQIMVQIDKQIQESQRQQAEASVTVAKAAIDMQKVMVQSTKSMLTAAIAQTESVKARLKNLATTKERLSQLFKEGAISKQHLDDAVSAHDSTAAQMTASIEGIQQAKDSIQTQQMTLKMKEAQLVQALANLNSTQVMLDKTTVKAAFDGIVTARFVDPGAMANPAKPLLRIEQMSPVKIVGAIIEKNLKKIIPGETVALITVDSLSDTFTGQVDKVYPTLNPITRTGKLEIAIKNPDCLLRSGMFAQIKLLLETKKGIIVVPRDVLMKHNGKNYAYVIRDGKAIKQEVETGIIQNTNVEIKQGLKRNEEIIAEGLEFIKEGSMVKPVFIGEINQ